MQDMRAMKLMKMEGLTSLQICAKLSQIRMQCRIA